MTHTERKVSTTWVSDPLKHEIGRCIETIRFWVYYRLKYYFIYINILQNQGVTHTQNGIVPMRNVTPSGLQFSGMGFNYNFISWVLAVLWSLWRYCQIDWRTLFDETDITSVVVLYFTENRGRGIWSVQHFGDGVGGGKANDVNISIIYVRHLLCEVLPMWPMVQTRRTATLATRTAS